MGMGGEMMYTKPRLLGGCGNMLPLENVGWSEVVSSGLPLTVGES